MRSLIALAGLVLASFAASAQPFIEGQHYKLVTPAQPTGDANKVEVIEVFSYACPHCASFQPTINIWHEKMPQNVEFSRIAVVFNPSWEPFARAYYAADALDLLDTSHQALFDKLHKERKRFRSMGEIAEFFTEFGVSEEDFMKAAQSFSVETQLRKGVAMTRRYGVEGTPSVIINGKYRSSVSMAGSPDALIALMNQLIASEAAAMSEANNTPVDMPADSGAAVADAVAQPAAG